MLRANAYAYPECSFRAHVTHGKVSISLAGLRDVLLPSERTSLCKGPPLGREATDPRQKCLGEAGIRGIGNVSWV